MNYPFVLVLEEKHGDYYYLMENNDDIKKFAIDTLTERFSAGYYYQKPDPVPDTFEEFFFDATKLALSEVIQLAEKHGSAIKIGVHNRTPSYEIESTKRDYVSCKTEFEEYQNIVAAVENKDGVAAWDILRNRSGEGYQYERFGMEPIENRRQS